MSQPATTRPRHFSTRSLLLAGSLVLVLGAGAFAIHSRMSGRSAAGESAPPPVVAVARIAREDLAQTLTLSGEFRPFQQVALHARIAGYLQSISVDVGDHVKEGQVLAQLDVPELQSDLQRTTAAQRASEQEVLRAEAAYREAHLAFQRLQKVAAEHPRLVAAQELDAAQARDATAEGALAVARQKVAECAAEEGKVRSLLAYTRITAPFDGVITRRLVDPGALVQPGTSSSSQNPLLELAEDRRLRLVFPVPQSAVALVGVGAPVRVTVGVLDTVLEGRVARFSGRIDRATRTMSTEVDFPNADGGIKPGMYASVELVTRAKPSAIAVPVQAIATGAEPRVLVVTGAGTIDERPVKLDLHTPDKAEAIAGVQPGELVVVGNRSTLRAGQRVTPRLLDLSAMP